MPTAAVTASRIREHMRRAGLNQGDIATALGKSQPQVSQRMRGEVDWRLAELHAIATLLDVPVSELVADEPAEAAS